MLSTMYNSSFLLLILNASFGVLPCQAMHHGMQTFYTVSSDDPLDQKCPLLDYNYHEACRFWKSTVSGTENADGQGFLRQGVEKLLNLQQTLRTAVEGFPVEIDDLNVLKEQQEEMWEDYITATATASHGNSATASND